MATDRPIPGRTRAEEVAAARWLGWSVGHLRELQKDSAVSEAFRCIGADKADEVSTNGD